MLYQNLPSRQLNQYLINLKLKSSLLPFDHLQSNPSQIVVVPLPLHLLIAITIPLIRNNNDIHTMTRICILSAEKKLNS